MQFDLSTEQKLLKEAARTLFQRQCPASRVRELIETEDAFDAALWKKYSDQGWTGLILPETYEGLELGVVDLAVLMEEMGRACVPGPFLSTVCAGVLLYDLAENDLAGSLLKNVAAGQARPSVALHESAPSWNLRSVGMELERGAGSIRLDGKKTLVGGGASAGQTILCVVRDETELAVALIPASRDGVQVRVTPSIDRTRPLGEVVFENVVVKEDDIIGRGGSVESALARMFQLGSVILCADMVGGMQWMMEAAVEYAKTREQFGRPIGAYQMVQMQCADMLLMLESARSATYYAAWALNERDPAAERAVSMAKAYCSDVCREVGHRSIQVHGGIGFTWEHDLHLYYKRAKASELMFGDATFHREQLAESLLDA
ncbi:MAG: Acyl-CoA dehydrogenase [Verrucomicrobia subdivision 3 bacterium]|nr:Acyl-CoA dehydrogenase [Limisphaerales bacterium]MCS1413906.1 Acyl-CoA dehydrogenase [Limisphaerales bacterium]